MQTNKIHCGDALVMLRGMEDESVQCCVTSPPYWGLRDYGVSDQIGMEATPQEFIAKMVELFEEVRRVLRPDGTLWLNLGDSYFGANWRGSESMGTKQATNRGANSSSASMNPQQWRNMKHDVLKPKDLCGIPWRVALTLQEAGWYLRCDIIWSKPNPMPESVRDRPTKSHEYLFMLAKEDRYYYDAEAIREKVVEDSDWEYRQRLRADKTYDLKEPYKDNFPGGHKPKVPANWHQGTRGGDKQRGHSRKHAGFNDRWDNMTKQEQSNGGRNKRSVWEIATKPYTGAHFATFPPALVEPCILAGSKPGDIVLDPFAGSGTTGIVAIQHGRKFIGFDINPEYCSELAAPRIAAAERGQTVDEYKSGQLTIFEGLEEQG
jgi:DNA modification methylase